MNFQEIQLVLRPRSMFEVLDLALIFLRRSLPLTYRLFLAAGLFWGLGLFVVSHTGLDLRARTALLIPWLLFLRFWMQTFLVLACGRLVFSEEVQWKDLLADLRAVGVTRLAGYGLWRLIKFLSGFGLLLPLWIILVRRFFDYEHWLLERLKGSEVVLRLRNFQTDARVFPFRLIHLVFLALSIFLGHQVLRIGFESLSRLDGPGLSPEFILTVFLLYDPFFIVSRFLLYIQIRTDSEAWDIGLLLREGIQKTFRRTGILLFCSVLGASLYATRIQAAPEGGEVPFTGGENAELVPCTEAMGKQPWLKCNPPAYRSYTAEEVEEHMPRQRPREQTDWGALAGVVEFLIYGAVFLLLAGGLYALWHRFARGARLPAESRSVSVLVQHGEPDGPPAVDELLRALEQAMNQEAWQEALGLGYLLLLRTQPEEAASLTPVELRARLSQHPDYAGCLQDFFDTYGLVFYARQQASAEAIEPALRGLVRMVSRAEHPDGAGTEGQGVAG